MRIEVLYPEVCNLFGDMQNINYLRFCIPDADFIWTQINQKPFFADNDIDMLYMGPCTENQQLKIIDKLMPFKDRLEELLFQNKVFLFTGNSFEIFGDYITNKTMSYEKKCLGFFHFHSVIDMFNRTNVKVLGNFDDIEIVGFKSQFSTLFGDNSTEHFVSCQRGFGFNKKSKFEGVRRQNFFGTSILGPLLPLNPPFTKKLLELLGVADAKIAFEKQAKEAYQARINEFKNPKIKF
ncbi:MAG: hypothetical protein DBX47_01445 [Clostridiales bacterium]|nr:MAG: hypothetical protein DBX47_01445 [Clostridiales bacterium]